MNPASDGGLPRAVGATNVYISAFLRPERPIFQIVQQAAEHRYRLLISSAIVNEVGRGAFPIFESPSEKFGKLSNQSDWLRLFG